MMCCRVTTPRRQPQLGSRLSNGLRVPAQGTRSPVIRNALAAPSVRQWHSPAIVVQCRQNGLRTLLFINCGEQVRLVLHSHRKPPLHLQDHLCRSRHGLRAYSGTTALSCVRGIHRTQLHRVACHLVQRPFDITLVRRAKGHRLPGGARPGRPFSDTDRIG